MLSKKLIAWIDYSCKSTANFEGFFAHYFECASFSKPLNLHINLKLPPIYCELFFPLQANYIDGGLHICMTIQKIVNYVDHVWMLHLKRKYIKINI